MSFCNKCKGLLGFSRPPRQECLRCNHFEGCKLGNMCGIYKYCKCDEIKMKRKYIREQIKLGHHFSKEIYDKHSRNS